MPTVLGSLLPAHLLLYAVTVAVSFVIGWACWHGYEKHFINLKQRLPYHSQPRLADEINPSAVPRLRVTQPALATGAMAAQAAPAAEQGPQS
jgi:peptidoglycan/LPS O-acetylase OafA/YrhL